MIGKSEDQRMSERDMPKRSWAGPCEPSDGFMGGKYCNGYEGMSDALEIMDEIEFIKEPAGPDGVPVSKQEWQSLRTAIGAQAEELAQKDARIARLEEVASAVVANTESDDARECRYCGDTDNSRHCTSGGSHDLVKTGELTDPVIPAPFIEVLQKTLNESPAQSAAHLKAEALYEAADELGPEEPAGWLVKRAARIEREAKEDL